MNVTPDGIQEDAGDETEESGPPIAIIAGVAGGGALALLAAFVMFRRSATGKEARAGAGGGAAGAEAAHESLDSPRHRPADAGVFDTGAAVVEVPPLYPNTYVPPVLPDLQSEIAEDELAAALMHMRNRQRSWQRRRLPCLRPVSRRHNLW